MLSVPKRAPSRYRLTSVTSPSSEAETVTLIVPETVAPLTGEEMVTVGGVDGVRLLYPQQSSTSRASFR